MLDGLKKVEEKGITFSIPQTITFRDIASALCNALEGGSGYWSTVHKYTAPENFDNSRPEDVKYEHMSFPINKGGSLQIKDLIAEEGEQQIYILNLKKIEKGLKIMAKDHLRHYHDLVTGNDDATTADVFLQCCVLGKVIYG